MTQKDKSGAHSVKKRKDPKEVKKTQATAAPTSIPLPPLTQAQAQDKIDKKKMEQQQKQQLEKQQQKQKQQLEKKEHQHKKHNHVNNMNNKGKIKDNADTKKKSVNQDSDAPIKKSQLRGRDSSTDATAAATATESKTEKQPKQIPDVEAETKSGTKPSSSTKHASTDAPMSLTSITSYSNPYKPDENAILRTITPCQKDPNLFQKIACFNSIHPGFVFSASLTIIIFLCYGCFFKRRPNRRFRPGFVSAFKRSRFRQRGGGANDTDDDGAGEYAALTVYDDLLDDFDKDDLGSYAEGGFSVNGAFESSDDDSVGTIISQWSDLNLKGGTGGQKQKIEMIPFDDGNLTLNEING